MTEVLSYVSGLFAPIQSKPQGKKVWSIDLETFWLPLFHASNVNGDTAISNEVMGCPVRLALTKDGEVKFGSNGRIVTRVHKDITNQVQAYRQNMMALSMQYIEETKKAKPDEWKKAITLSQKAGQPVAERESKMAQDAIQARLEAEEAEAKAQAEAQARDATPKAKEKTLAGVAS